MQLQIWSSPYELDCFMAKWHRDDAQISRLSHATSDGKIGDMGWERGAALLIQLLSTNAGTK